MKKVLQFILLCSLSLMFSTGCYAADSAIQDLKNLLLPIQGLSADFQQKMTNDQGKVLQESKGHMWLKKPGQFRWEVQGNDARLVVSNGKKVWDYDKDLEQVTIQNISKKDIKAPIFFLTGDVQSLEKDFKIALLAKDGKTCIKESDRCFVLLPKSDNFVFQKIHVGFKGNVLKELVMIDQLNQHSYFLFNNAKLNPVLQNKFFNFEIPKGVDRVGN